jgi:hypothetical protein
MLAAGFLVESVEGEEIYKMQASADAWPRLVATKSAVEAAVRQAQTAANQSTAPPAGAIPGFSAAGGMPGLPAVGGLGLGSMPMDAPEIQRAVAQLAANPGQLQAMLQVGLCAMDCMADANAYTPY